MDGSAVAGGDSFAVSGRSIGRSVAFGRTRRRYLAFFLCFGFFCAPCPLPSPQLSTDEKWRHRRRCDGGSFWNNTINNNNSNNNGAAMEHGGGGGGG